MNYKRIYNSKDEHQMRNTTQLEQTFELKNIHNKILNENSEH
jgi:hypothetical protein